MSDIECFQEKYLEDAVKLCIENYTNLRNMIPLLPERYEQSGVVFSLLQGIIQEHPGVVCLEQGTLSGYMTGFQRIPYFKGIQQGVYIPEWGHAAPGVRQKSAECLRA